MKGMTMDTDSEKRASLMGEYQIAAENIRHFQNLRFASMTVSMAIMGGLFAGLFQWTEVLTSFTRSALESAGLVVALVFWIQDERIVVYWKHFIHRAIALEKGLSYEQYSTQPTRRRFTAGNAFRVLYLVLTLFWLVVLVGNARLLTVPAPN